MPRYLIFILILSLTFVKTTAQEYTGTENNITVSTGLNHGYFKDLNFSPLNYSGSGINYRLSYSRKTTKNVFLTSLEFNDNHINTVQQTGFPKSEYLHGKLKIAYLKKVNRTSRKVDFFLGGQYQSNINYIEFLDESNSFLLAHSLDISSFSEYSFNIKHSISVFFSLPLIALTVRPPYSGFDEELEQSQDKPFRLITNGKLKSANKYFAPSFWIRHEYDISNSFSVFGAYQLYYQKLRSRDTFTTFQNQIRIGLNCKF